LKDSLFSKSTLNIRGKIMDLSRPKVMGILNITPDSFYSGSRHESEQSILDQATTMVNEGADFLDVGGYSTRPGAAHISVDEELTRVLSAIDVILKELPDAVISIDTFRSEVAQAAVKAGASIVNDISGGTMDQHMFEVVAQLQCPYILMHMRGTPQTMSDFAIYDSVAVEVLDELGKKVQKLKALGVKDIILDPGFGFAKSVDQNYQLLKNLGYIKLLQLPLLVGVSRKSMIYKFLGTTPENALHGTIVLNTLALLGGAKILRVHDVKEAVEVINLVDKYNQS
jgi:dihydropteroate synthase